MLTLIMDGSAIEISFDGRAFTTVSHLEVGPPETHRWSVEHDRWIAQREKLTTDRWILFAPAPDDAQRIVSSDPGAFLLVGGRHPFWVALVKAGQVFHLRFIDADGRDCGQVDDGVPSDRLTLRERWQKRFGRGRKDIHVSLPAYDPDEKPPT